MFRITTMSAQIAGALAASAALGFFGPARAQVEADVPATVVEDYHRTCAGEIDRYKRLGAWVRDHDRSFRQVMDVQETRSALRKLDARLAEQVRQLPAGTDPGTRQQLMTTSALGQCQVHVALRYTPDSAPTRAPFVGQWVPLSSAASRTATALAYRIPELTIAHQPDGLAVYARVEGVSGLYLEQPRTADGWRRFRRDLAGGGWFQITFEREDDDALRFEDGTNHADFKRVIFRSFAPNTDPLPPETRP